MTVEQMAMTKEKFIACKNLVTLHSFSLLGPLWLVNAIFFRLVTTGREGRGESDTKF